MKKFLLLTIIIFSFIFLKNSNLGIRLSDTNIYFNIASQIAQGKVLYKNIFFTNFPLFAYLSWFYYWIGQQNILFFYFTSVLEIAIITFLIYYIIYKKTKDYITSITSSLLYIFSFIVLSTSDHQTGVFSASLFAVLGFYFLQEKKLFISGALISLSLLIKAYFLPIALSFFCYFLLQKEWKKIGKLSLGFILTSFLVLLPFLIQAPKQLISDIFGFSLTRPTGTLKTEIAWFFIAKDFIFFILLLFNFINFKKNVFFALVSLFSILFFFGYQDIYYLYLNFLIPFLCLSFYEISIFIKKLFSPQRLVIPTVILIFAIYNLFVYITNYRNLQKVNDVNQIISVIKREKPTYIYGVDDITPALSSITKIPALENVNDAYVYFFRKGIYNKTILTNKAISTKTIVLTHGASYPEFNIHQDILDDEILDKETIYKHCKIILTTPVKAEGATNRINLFKCYQ